MKCCLIKHVQAACMTASPWSSCLSTAGAGVLGLVALPTFVTKSLGSLADGQDSSTLDICDD